MSNSFKTFLKHTAKDFHNHSVNPPVVRASTIIFKSMNDIRKTQNKYKKDPRGGYFDYGRQGTSTTHILQKILTISLGISFLQLFGYESIIFALAISYVFYLKRIIESFRKMENFLRLNMKNL